MGWRIDVLNLPWSCVLQERGLALPGLLGCPDAASQLRRLQEAGWARALGGDMLAVYASLLAKEDRDRWGMRQRGYHAVWGW
jgi:hypothetical protein